MHQNREKRDKKLRNFTDSIHTGELKGRGWPGNPLRVPDLLPYANSGLLSSCGFISALKTGGGVGSGSLNVPLRADWINVQIFSGLSGMSMLVIPSGARASRTALTMVGGAAIGPASPTPFAPSGLMGEGVSTRAVTKSGTCWAFGRA